MDARLARLQELGTEVSLLLVAWSFPLTAGLALVLSVATWVLMAWSIASGHLFYVCR